MPKKTIQRGAVIYQAKSGAIELKGDFSKETLWATQAQISKIFGVERSVVTKHINNILKSQEIDQKSNVQKMHIANSDKPVKYYNLNVKLGGYTDNTGDSTKNVALSQQRAETAKLALAKLVTVLMSDSLARPE